MYYLFPALKVLWIIYLSVSVILSLVLLALLVYACVQTTTILPLILVAGFLVGWIIIYTRQ